MCETRVVVNDAVPALPGDLAVRLTGPTPTFRLRIEHIERRLSTRLDDLSLDLLEIAAAVFSADSSISRGGAVRRDFGADWRRRFRFVCPVRSIAFWTDEAVREALTEAVSFLTDDHVRFEFHEAATPPRAEEYLPFDAPTNEGLRGEEVLLFSGGLDSLAGAIETIDRTEAPVWLVSHRSAPKITRRQRDLVDALSEWRPGRFRWIPVEATRIGSEASDTTERSRSFLFAALGFAVARMVGARHVRFFENGIVSANLPFARPIIGTMATRTTHPLALRRLDALLGHAPGARVRLDNPYAWLTKTQVVAKLKDADQARLVDTTISCTNVYGRSNQLTHCGACSQCLDRRFALLAAGMEASDDPDHYETEVMTGPRDERSRRIAFEWTRHALEMPGTVIDFYAKFGSELPRLVDGFPDRPEVEVARDLLDLHLRHSASVRSALDVALHSARERLLAGDVPETALLRMVIGRHDGRLQDASRPEEAPDAEEVPPAERPPAVEPSGLWPAQIVIEDEDRLPTVRILGVTEFTGNEARLIAALRDAHEEDAAQELPRDAWQCTSIHDLVDRLGLDQEHVRQLVSRIRDNLRGALAALGIESPKQPLIQNEPRKGYRLDPLARFVRPDPD